MQPANVNYEERIDGKMKKKVASVINVYANVKKGIYCTLHYINRLVK